MFLSSAEIERNKQWLVANASRPVAYLTRLRLKGENPASAPMHALWQEIQSDPGATVFFDSQNPDGSWFCGGPWGPRGYRRQGGVGYTATRPKFVTTGWLLPFLGEMGFAADQPGIRQAVDYLQHRLPELTDTEHAAIFPENSCGIAFIGLWALASVGLGGEKQLEPEWRRLLASQRADGGWLNAFHLADANPHCTTQGRWPWDRSCAWGTYYAGRALMAALTTTQHSSLATRLRDDLQRSLASAAGFLYGHLERQDPANLYAWVHHGHNLVRELEMFAQVGYPVDRPVIQTVLGWLRGFYHSDEGAFRIQEQPFVPYTRQVASVIREYSDRHGPRYWPAIAKVSPNVLRYQLYHLIEDDWLTYRLTSLAEQFNGRH
jgi:hypothetical protein